MYALFTNLGGVAVAVALAETGTAEERYLLSCRSLKYQKSLQ